MKKTLKVIAAVAVVLFVFWFLFVDTSTDNTGEESSESTTTIASIVETVTTVEATETSEATTAETTPEVETTATTDIIGINDTLHAENFDFSIISATTCGSFQNAFGADYEADDGNEFLIIVFSATNTANEDMNVLYSGFNSYVDDVKVSVSAVAGAINGYMPLIGAVSSGKTFEAYSVWELPIGWEKFEFSYIDALSGSDSDMFTIFATDVN